VPQRPEQGRSGHVRLRCVGRRHRRRRHQGLQRQLRRHREPGAG